VIVLSDLCSGDWGEAAAAAAWLASQACPASWLAELAPGLCALTTELAPRPCSCSQGAWLWLHYLTEVVAHRARAPRAPTAEQLAELEQEVIREMLEYVVVDLLLLVARTRLLPWLARRPQLAAPRSERSEEH
jgi:hypothetical protein